MVSAIKNWISSDKDKKIRELETTIRRLENRIEFYQLSVAELSEYKSKRKMLIETFGQLQANGLTELEYDGFKMKRN